VFVVFKVFFEFKTVAPHPLPQPHLAPCLKIDITNRECNIAAIANPNPSPPASAKDGEKLPYPVS